VISNHASTRLRLTKHQAGRTETHGINCVEAVVDYINRRDTRRDTRPRLESPAKGLQIRAAGRNVSEVVNATLPTVSSSKLSTMDYWRAPSDMGLSQIPVSFNHFSRIWRQFHAPPNDDVENVDISKLEDCQKSSTSFCKVRLRPGEGFKLVAGIASGDSRSNLG
jgi:hypothetical protein